MSALLEASFGIDQHIGDILHVAHLPFALTDFEQGIVGGGRRVGRVEQQHAAVTRPKAGGELVILALDVVNDHRAGPSQQRRHNQADALARPRRGEAQHVLRAIMPKVMPLVSAEHHAVIGKQTGPRYFAAVRPPRRAARLGLLGLSPPPDRLGDGDEARKSTRLNYSHSCATRMPYYA